jgi:hypothetical protein
VGEIGFLLSASESLTLLSLGLFIFLDIGGTGFLLGTLGLVLSNSLAFWLLGRGSGSGSLLLGLGSLALFLSLGLGVVIGVP